MTVDSTVLVTAAGSIVAQGIMKCLKLANTNASNNFTYRIVSSDMSALAAGLYRSNKGFLVPEFSATGFVDSIIKICKEEAVQAVFVGSDEELMPMANAKERLQKETGAIVITNPPEVILVCSDKWKTYQHLKKSNLPCAESSLPENLKEFINEFGFPIVVKPREGHGSVHFHVVNSLEETERAISAIQKVGWHSLLQEYISSDEDEFTIGVTVDRSGGYVMSSISMKRTLKSGQTYKAFVDDFKEVRKTAEEAAMKLGARGPINVQGRLDEDRLKIFEINPRFSASCPVRAVAKINEPDIVYRNTVLNEEIRVTSYQKIVCLRFWDEVYVPFPLYEKALNLKKVEGTDSFVLDYF